MNWTRMYNVATALIVVGTVFYLGFMLKADAWGASEVRQSEHDPRVRYVTFKPDDVTSIQVKRGVLTRIVLEQDERIIKAGTGFAAECKDDTLEWCITADPETDQVWVKPREHATHNNLELRTTKRDYSIRFEVLADSATRGEAYRVIFQYLPPVPVLPAAMVEPDPATLPVADAKVELEKRLAAKPVVKNGRYSKAVLGQGPSRAKGAAIAPTLVFDDGRMTYFRFPGQREVPAAFVLGEDGADRSSLNWHMDGDFMVLHRIASGFVLRLGNDAAVAIYNEAFNAEGVATPSGVVVPGVQRVLKEATK